MHIVCPRCGFSRDVSPERLPSRAVMATCPHCACRFRVVVTELAQDGKPEDTASPVAPVDERIKDQMHGDVVVDCGGPEKNKHSSAVIPASQEYAAYEDDPLPPGAVIPGRMNAPHTSIDGDEPHSSVHDQKSSSSASPVSGTGMEVTARSDKSTARDRADPLPDGVDTLQDDESRGTNPWELAPAPTGWVAALYHTCLRVMFSAPHFFGHLQDNTPQLRPLMFYGIISFIQVLVEKLWSCVLLSLMSSSAGSDPELSKMLDMLSSQLSLPLMILLKVGFAVAQLYILAVLLHFTYGFIAKQRATFSRIFQITAYAAAPSLLCVVPVLGSIAGWIWMLACLLVGLRTAMRLSWSQTLLGFLPVVALLVPLVLQMIKAVQG